MVKFVVQSSIISVENRVKGQKYASSSVRKNRQQLLKLRQRLAKPKKSSSLCCTVLRFGSGPHFHQRRERAEKRRTQRKNRASRSLFFSEFSASLPFLCADESGSLVPTRNCAIF